MLLQDCANFPPIILFVELGGNHLERQAQQRR